MDGSGVRRRAALVGLGALAVGPLVGRVAAGDGLFSLGVASGDPLPDGVVLWTRLAPDPLSGGGMPSKPVEVRWRVAADEGLKRVVAEGTVTARPEGAHAVHVEVGGLEPGRWYWYRFEAMQAASPVGRTRTAPATGGRVERLRFAFASCQHYETGHYAAYRDMAAQDLDFVVHLGDYIYERAGVPGRVRMHRGGELVTLEEYRNRYALYKSDPLLQAAHAAFPWIVTWDDHEVDNNYAADVSEDGQGRDAFLARRAAAYQAYYEHMPLRSAARAVGANLQLYRRLGFRDLAQVHVLDTQQYRSDQPCGDGFKPRCPEALAAAATMTGTAQEQWLLDGLNRSPARWNIIAQQTVLAQFDSDPGSGELYNLDQWDGYVAARERLLKFLALRRPSNPVVITGDVHSSWVFDLKADFNDPRSVTVGTEFAGTSISSGFSKEVAQRLVGALPANPHARYFDGLHRGYTLCTLTGKEWRTQMRVVEDPARPESPVTTAAEFVVEDGRPGAKRV